MPSSFYSRVEEKQSSLHTKVCVGADPHVERLTGWFAEQYENDSIKFLQNFGEAVIRAAQNRVACIKLQSAFYECHGGAGVSVMKSLCELASQAGLEVILDAKRCDISTSMRAYGKFAFDYVGAHALTVVPYMGPSVVETLEDWLGSGRAAIVVWRSSNSDAGEWQNHVAREIISKLVELDARRPGAIGIVAGATILDSMAEEEWQEATRLPMLVPGFGPQGGRVGDRLKDLAAAKRGHIFPVQRAVTGFGDQTQTSRLEEIVDWAGYQDFCTQNLVHYCAMLK